MKFSLALSVILVGCSINDIQVSSFFIPNGASSSHSHNYRQPKTSSRRSNFKSLFGGVDNNSKESFNSNNGKQVISPFLDNFVSSYLSKSFPRSSVVQQFKLGSDFEDEQDPAFWAKALRKILPSYFSSQNQRTNTTQIINGADIESNSLNTTVKSNSQTAFSPEAFSVSGLLHASEEFNLNEYSNENLNSYLDAILMESKITDEVLHNMSTKGKIKQESNSTTSNFLSSFDWGTSNFALSTPITMESVIERTTSQINFFFLKAATSLMAQSDEAIASNINSKAIQDILQNINVSSRGLSMAVDKMLEETETFARENGLDVGLVVEEARGNAMELIEFGSAVLVDGYVSETSNNQQNLEMAKEITNGNNVVNMQSKALFDEYDARSVTPDELISTKAGKMANLAAAIYESDVVDRAHKLEQTIVASGCTSDASWLITDSIIENVQEIGWDKSPKNNKPALVRTITIKGFDATDENVDRERLLGNIWTATPEKLSDDGRVVVHTGLLSVARDLYKDLSQYIDGLAPTHKIVLNGHSIGGSLSNLLLMFLAKERGAEWVKQRVLKVFTFGAPPIASITDNSSNFENLFITKEDFSPGSDLYKCEILTSFGLPSTMVDGFCQPWDPCLRLFSTIDPIYPLLDDIGADGKTLWASGPNRALRPITRAIIESWENWPSLRDKYRETASQSYISTGMQYLLMPETSRYLMDRLVSVNLAVPETEVVVKLPPSQLFGALDYAFPLDTFGISMVPAALRSFIHHFHPAYTMSIDVFTQTKPLISSKDYLLSEEEESKIRSYLDEDKKITEMPTSNGARGKNKNANMDWAGAAASWVLGDFK